MSNKTLDDRAKSLEREIKAKFSGYCVVGWMRHPDVGPVFTVYIDRRVAIPDKLIPDKWFGIPVFADRVFPPGVKPTKADMDPW